jgi:hypothetical protein
MGLQVGTFKTRGTGNASAIFMRNVRDRVVEMNEPELNLE